MRGTVLDDSDDQTTLLFSFSYDLTHAFVLVFAVLLQSRAAAEAGEPEVP